jgi:hypothetical protein
MFSNGARGVSRERAHPHRAQRKAPGMYPGLCLQHEFRFLIGAWPLASG